jgi:translocator protein
MTFLPSDPFYAALLWGGIGCIVVAVAGGLLTRMSDWYYNLRKPSWKPPDWAFGPIWTVVFTCIAFATAYAWAAASEPQRPMIVAALLVNGILNMAWSPLFFMMKRPDLAMIELMFFWLSIVVLIVVFGAVSSTAALLLLPYIAWVTTAGFLNYRIIRLNRA